MKHDDIEEGKSLIVRHLRNKISREELADAFEKYGHVVDVHIPRDYFTG